MSRDKAADTEVNQLTLPAPEACGAWPPACSRKITGGEKGGDSFVGVLGCTKLFARHTTHASYHLVFVSLSPLILSFIALPSSHFSNVELSV